MNCWPTSGLGKCIWGFDFDLAIRVVIAIPIVPKGMKY